MNTEYTQTRTRYSGYSVVELLVAVAIGLLVMAGILGLFVTNKGVFTSTTQATELQESGRFALSYLLQDLRHAYFFGEKHYQGFVFATDSGAPRNDEVDPDTQCDGMNAVYSFNANSSPTSFPLHGTAATASSAIGCIEDALVVSGIPSDILVIKSAQPRAFNNTADLSDGNVYIASNRLDGVMRLFTGDVTMPSLSPSCSGPPDVCLPFGTYWPYRFAAYYIRAPGTDRDPPTLARMVMKWDATAGMTVVPEDLVDGVEGMRVLYGISTDNEPPVYVSASAVGNWDDVVSVQVYLLLRSTRPDPGHQDSRTYQMGDLSVTATSGTAVSQGAQLRNFRRHLISTSVMLRNKRLTEN